MLTSKIVVRRRDASGELASGKVGSRVAGGVLRCRGKFPPMLVKSGKMGKICTQ